MTDPGDAIWVVAQRGPRTGSRFRLPAREVRVLGSSDAVAWRVPEIAPRAAVFRRSPHPEVQLLVAGRINDQDAPPEAWIEVCSGDRITIGEHDFGIREGDRAAPLACPSGFILEGELGRGGSGVVYLARRADSGERIALKVLHWTRPHHVERFRREAATCLELEHPAIVRVLDFDLDGDMPWIALEHVRGSDAAAIVRVALPPIERALSIARDVATAIAWLAERNLVHRDVKPENVLVTETGAAKLTDFGLVKDLSGEFERLTATGSPLGTLAYAAPEQLEGRASITSAADVHGLGVTLFRLLTGTGPWSGETRTKRDVPPRDVRELRPSVPGVVARILGTMLRVDPARRPTPEQVIALLEPLRES